MKLFTIEEADALLPRVRPIVERIRRSHRVVILYSDQARRAAEAATTGGGGVAGGTDYIRHATRLSAAIEELNALGVLIKDRERGLIDFPSLRGDRVVLLCWHPGEGDRIEWWHDLADGFAGRQPL